MAELSFAFDDDFMKQLQRLDNVDETMKKMIDEAKPIVVTAMKNELSKYKGTGELVNSIKSTKAKRSTNGTAKAIIRPTGKSTFVIAKSGRVYKRKSVRNMEKIASLEFGNSRGERPTPIIETVVKATQNSVMDKMMEVYLKETKL